MVAETAVVAGGGSGIGRGCALHFAQRGHLVVLVGRTAAKLEATAGEIAAAGGEAEVWPLDLRDWEAVATLGEHLAATGVNLVVNAAGGQFAQPSARLSANGWRAVIETNLTGSFFLLRHLYPALRKRRGAAVLVVADLWRRPAPGLAHAAAARAGVVSLVRTLALEWAGDGIRVNAVSPGLTDTPALRPEYAALVEAVPLGRLATVAEVVEAVDFLARARYVTGEVLTVDGGLNLTAVSDGGAQP
ncbi:MAG: short-chain dehydrogenase [Porticoccaceae bacterium]|nr:MAG: short-chain dehydrogenase [Porticoccaceae bacterium]